MASKKALGIRKEAAIASINEVMDLDLSNTHYLPDHAEVEVMERVAEAVQKLDHSYKVKLGKLQAKVDRLEKEEKELSQEQKEEKVTE